MSEPAFSPRRTAARPLLPMLAALLAFTCGSGSALLPGGPDAQVSGTPDAPPVPRDAETCGEPDAEITCTDVCGDLEEFRRFPCDKPPTSMCDAQGNPARPLNKAQLDYVVAKCRTCSNCTRNCQSCGAGLPPY